MTVTFHDAVVPFLRPIDEVRQHPRNVNMGDVDAIADSILLNGFYTVTFAQRSTGFLVAGNHRYEALLSLDATEIPVLLLDLSDEEAETLLIADNEIAALAKRDESGLLSMVRSLNERGVHLAKMGFNDTSLKDLITKVNIRQHTPLPTDISVDYRMNKRAKVVVDGYMEGDEFTAFTYGDLGDVVVRLKDLGYRAIGGEHD